MHLGFKKGRLASLLRDYASLKKRKTRFLLAGAMVVLAAATALLSQWLLATPAAVLFVLGVVACSALFGLAAGLFASALAVLALDYFFISPIYHIELDSAVVRVAIVFVLLAGLTHPFERRLCARFRKYFKSSLGMHGSVDGLMRGELYGWAMDADWPSNPVTVTLLIDKHPVANVAAVYDRPDVAGTMECSGRHGFYIDLAPYFPVERNAWIDVQLPDGRSLDNAPRRLNIPAVTPRAAKPTIIFMHIPKTAGTAFREAMAANFVQSEIAYQYPGPPGFLTPDLRLLPLEQRRAFRIVIGHLQFGVHETLPQRSDYITVVREPGARLLSQYSFQQHEQPELMRGKNGRFLSLLELLEHRLTADFDNAMVRCFSGVDERDFPPGTLTEDIYERARDNMRRNFTFVGHQEKSAEAYDWLRRYYGWDAKLELPNVNRGRSQTGGQIDDNLRAVLRERNRWDYRLYDDILKLFPPTRVAMPQRDPVLQHGVPA